MDYLSIDFFYQLLRNNLGLVFFLIVLVLLYHYYTATHNYFREKGIPFKKPKIIVGNIAERIFLKISFHEFNIAIYKYFDGLPYGGYFEGRRPLLLIRCPELLKTIMIKDFDHFVDRNTIMNSRAPDSIKKMLINLKGKEWKGVRAILTPAFSSSKLRGMENLVQQCGRQMVEFLKNRTGDNDLEMKEFIGRFTLEVIGSCAFGLDCASLKDPNAQFVKDAAKFTDISIFNRAIFFFILTFCPHALRFLRFNFFNTEALQSLSDVVMGKKQKREDKTENRRNDFLQLMMDAAQKEVDDNSSEKIISEGVIQAQAILFLFAGFETTSTLLSFACAVLCEYPDIQDRLRNEINEVAKKNKDCTYDCLRELHFMEKVFLETLRMYPPVSRVDRVCTKPYTLPGTNVNLDTGDVVAISISGIMMDPEHYPDPHVFDPERFSPEEKAKRAPHLFLPFGGGPRNCIGLRFAMMSAKFAMFYLLRDFKLSSCAKTQYPIEYERKAMLLKSKHGAWMKVEAIS
ncbi:cytochrome P450 9e2-like isoform X2 [Arctopsyche grandis]|uniref:cytochrome P450 9e2-like isoform X2 n=1 Tax=Arctopsyche grandis TaxID=121162 RepID=UPI00406D93D9